jgi:hypothetical protein
VRGAAFRETVPVPVSVSLLPVCTSCTSSTTDTATPKALSLSPPLPLPLLLLLLLLLPLLLLLLLLPARMASDAEKKSSSTTDPARGGRGGTEDSWLPDEARGGRGGGGSNATSAVADTGWAAPSGARGGMGGCNGCPLRHAQQPNTDMFRVTRTKYNDRQGSLKGTPDLSVGHSEGHFSKGVVRCLASANSLSKSKQR